MSGIWKEAAHVAGFEQEPELRSKTMPTHKSILLVKLLDHSTHPIINQKCI